MPDLRMRVVRRSTEDLTDSQIEQLMTFGRREADLLDKLEAATRAGDRNLVFEIAQVFCQLEEENRGSWQV